MKSLNIYVLTFNCARNLIETERFASHLFEGLNHPPTVAASSLPDILILALQEVAPIAYAFLGGSYLDQYYNAFRQAVDLATVQHVSDEDVQYRNLLTRNVGMTAIMVFAKEHVSERIRYIEVAETGVGVQEAGNKGAVGARIGYLARNRLADGDDIDVDGDGDGDDGIVEMTFVSAHLAPDENGWKRRNDDWKSIAERLIFRPDPIRSSSRDARHHEDEEGVPLLESASTSESSALYSPRSYIFVAGDFNYRTSDTSISPDDFKRFPRPAGDLTDFSHFEDLFARDQLTRERIAGRVFSNLLESKITFPPSYKYSIEACNASSTDPNGLWKWAKNRWPSWCDRILYSNHPSIKTEVSGIEVHKYDVLPLLSTSDHRPVLLSASVPLQPLPEPLEYQPPFDVDTQWRTKREIARRKELVVGAVAFLGLTWEGNGLLLATILSVSVVYYGFAHYIGT